MLFLPVQFELQRNFVQIFFAKEQYFAVTFVIKIIKMVKKKLVVVLPFIFATTQDFIDGLNLYTTGNMSIDF